MIETSRRRFIKGLVTLVAAPAIVRVASLMPVKAYGSLYLTPTEITREAVRRFRDSNLFLAEMDRQYELDCLFMAGEQWPVGSQLKIRLPAEYNLLQHSAA